MKRIFLKFNTLCIRVSHTSKISQTRKMKKFPTFVTFDTRTWWQVFIVDLGARKKHRESNNPY